MAQESNYYTGYDPSASLALAQARGRRSLMVALSLAMALHVGLIAFLIQMVIARGQRHEPDLIVAAPLAPVEQLVERRAFSQLKADRPSPPSGAQARVMTALSVAPIVIPEVDVVVEQPLELGAGFGEDLGLGIGGTGLGKGATFFGTPAAGRSVILVIDVSTSMPRNLGEEGLALLRREIERTIHSLSPRTLFNLICFGNQADGFRPACVVASGENKKAAVAFMADYFTTKFTRTRTEAVGKAGELEGIRYVPIMCDEFDLTRDTSGGSRYDLALIAAFQQHPETIFLMTDGNPSTQKDGQELGREEILALVQKGANRAGGGVKPRINGISVNGVGADYLQEITKAFRGDYKEIKGGNL